MDINQAKAQGLGHLGLVAATLQDTHLMDAVDKVLGKVEAGRVSYGHRVGAMILNGLGFINTALYMTPRFFHDKPLWLLLGDGVTAEQLNDDCLGRCLDKIAEYGVTKWYSEIALSVVQQAGLMCRGVHLDSTTLSLYGVYERYAGNGPLPLHGYSKDKRPDLKQVTLQLVSLGKGLIPIWMEALDGNSSDKKSFCETAKRANKLCQAIKESDKLCFIADSALYGEGLKEIEADWLTRVPESYGECKALCARRDIAWKEVGDGYQVYGYQPKNSEERWLMVRSEAAYRRENETFVKAHHRHFIELEKTLWHYSCQSFECEKDARSGVEKLLKSKGKLYQVEYEIVKVPHYASKGRPKSTQAAEQWTYQVKVQSIATDYLSAMVKRETMGRFVLATNVLDTEEMSDESMLRDYKNQSSIEQGFRFVKNDTFGLDEVYLKKPSRIGALMAIIV